MATETDAGVRMRWIAVAAKDANTVVCSCSRIAPFGLNSTISISSADRVAAVQADHREEVLTSCTHRMHIILEKHLTYTYLRRIIIS